jgi:hypothetical protein
MIKTEMESVLEGPNADFSDALDRQEAALDTSITAEVVPKKSFWALALGGDLLAEAQVLLDVSYAVAKNAMFR